jgi:hypothetical protein
LSGAVDGRVLSFEAAVPELRGVGVRRALRNEEILISTGLCTNSWLAALGPTSTSTRSGIGSRPMNSGPQSMSR